jgi:hypothetical protein
MPPLLKEREKNSQASAPKARNVKAWAAPQVKVHEVLEALKARNMRVVRK